MKLSRFLIQLAIGVFLVFYAIRSEMIDWELLRKLATDPLALLANFIFLSLIMGLLTLRWLRWAETFQLGFSYYRLLHIGMASAFLCTFLPSSIGNDLAKIGLGIGDHPSRKSQVLFTVFLDRLIGLYMMLIFPGIVLLLLPTAPHLPLRGFLVSGAILLLVFPLVATRFRFSDRVRALNFFKAQELANAYDYFLIHRKTLLKVFTLTLLVTLINVLQYVAQASLMDLSLGTFDALWMIPLGLLACALPFLPLGIGIG